MLAIGRALMQTLAFADNAVTPLGVWVTVDDNTKKPRSHVEIYEIKGKLQGRIIKLLNPTVKDPKCVECEGANKNKPILGMTIMWGLEKDDDREWEDGRILDPANGKVYRCNIEVSKDGKHLEVRGYVGLSLFGRTQTWHRL